MKRQSGFSHEFVDAIPEILREGVLYVSIRHATALHLCACGCREEVVTPLSPVAWAITFDGRTVSLSPSIGNWSLRCRSHYWIRRGRVVWSEGWSEERIERAAEQDRLERADYYDKLDGPDEDLGGDKPRKEAAGARGRQNPRPRRRKGR